MSGPPAGTTGPADAELVAGVLSGDRNSFAALYDRYADRLHDFCYSLLRDRDDAADATQDTFVLAAERLGQLRDPERLRPWLYAIARNEAMRRLRGRGRFQPDTEVAEMADPRAGPAEAAEQAALRELVWNAAAGLADRDRVLLDLHVRQGLEGAELGEAMGVSAAHGYVMLNRLREQVERSMGALLIARLGRDDCAVLNGLLSGWDGRFSPLIRKRVARHVDGCDMCRERRRTMVSPLALLSTVPVVAAPPALRDRVLERVAATHHGPTPPRTPGGRGRVLGAAAAAVLVAVAGVALWRGAAEPPASPAAGGGPPPLAVPSAATSPTPSYGTSAPVAAPDTTGAPRVPPAALATSTDVVELGTTESRGTVVLSNTGGETLRWTAEPADPWLAADPPEGVLAPGATAPLTLAVDRAALREGDSDGTVAITWGGGTASVLVTLTEERPPEIRDAAASPETIAERGCQSDRASVSAAVADESGVASVTLSWTGPDGTSSSQAMTLRSGRWYATLGPFDEYGDAVWRITATDTRDNTTTSEDATLAVAPCVR